MNDNSQKRFLVVGANGQLGRAFSTLLAGRGGKTISLDRAKLDITDADQVQRIMAEHCPDVLINAAGFTDVESAETNFAQAVKINETGVLNLRNACQETQAVLVHFSSDYVFGGEARKPYVEADTPAPINAYGKSKWLGDQVLLKSEFKDFLIIRSSWIFGHGEQNFFVKLLKWSETNDVLDVVYDQLSTPTYSVDIANIVLQCVEANLRGLYNLSNSGYASRFEVARELFRQLGREKLVLPVPSRNFNSPVKRPYFSQLSNRQLSSAIGITIPTWQNALNRYLIQEGLQK